MRQFRKSSVNPVALLLVALLTNGFIGSASAQEATRQDDDDEVIRVETNRVLLNVTVTNKDGSYVHGLKAKDFTVFEDGRPQPAVSFEQFSIERTPFAGVILLDTSGSMDERMSLARSAALRFLDRLRDEDVAAIYRFDTKVVPVQDFSQSRDMPSLFYDMKADGYTALFDAVVRGANDLSARAEKRRAIVILSDGLDNRSSASPDKALNAALSAHATIYTVDMTSPEVALGQRVANAGQLKTLAAKSGGRYLATPGGRTLREAFENVADELHNQYTLVYKPSDVRPDGRFRKLEVRVARADATVRTRSGFRVPKNK